MANENQYKSQYTGAEMDARFTAVPLLQQALTELEELVATKYRKPAGGIPADDMDAEVQTALNKALTSIQSLANYYTKEQVDAIASAIAAAVNSTSAEIVATLPEASAATLGNIYYVGPTDGEYKRYVTSYDGSTYSWLDLGTTAITLSGYATLDDLDDLREEVYEDLYVITNIGDMNYSQTASNSQLKSLGFTMLKGHTYRMYIKLTGFSTNNLGKLNHIYLYKNANNRENINFGTTDYFGYHQDFADQDWHSIIFTPTMDLMYIRTEFVSTYVADDPAGMVYFKAEEHTDRYVKTSDLDLNELDNFMEGSIEDNTSLFVSGYYSISGKSVGDQLPARSTSSDLMVARVPISKGVTVKSNTMLSVTNTVGHILIARENIIVAFPTTAQINAGYTLTDAQIAAGAYQLVVVYRISTQTDAITLQSFYNYEYVTNSFQKKPLDEKTVILCGDSQLAQAGTFETWIKASLGGNILNCGFGGARMSCRDAERTGAFDPFSMVEVAETLVDRDFTRMDNSSHAEDTHYPESIANLKSLTNLGNGKDVILTIAYGGNDFSNNVPLGDATVENVATYLGALAYAVRTLLTAFPRMVILVVGCPYRVYEYTTDPDTGVKTITEDSDQKINSLGLYRYDYNDAAVRGAAALKLPGFDMYHRSGRNKFNAFTLCPNDGTHPTSTAGRRAEGELYVKILSTF